MDFRDSPDQAAWRSEVRTFLEKEKPKVDPEANMMELARDRNAVPEEWREKLAARGLDRPRTGRRSTAAPASTRDGAVHPERRVRRSARAVKSAASAPR